MRVEVDERGSGRADCARMGRGRKHGRGRISYRYTVSTLKRLTGLYTSREHLIANSARTDGASAADMGAPSLDSLIAKIRASAAKDRSMAQALANASGAITAATAASPPPPRYTPLSLTFVSYVQGDRVGKLAALVTLTPIFAHIALGSWILARRELHAAGLFVGSVLNTALCVAIKTQAWGSVWV